MQYDYITIGAGMGGLSTANFLAKYNKKVLVLEKNSIPGGLVTSFARKGVHFDLAGSPRGNAILGIFIERSGLKPTLSHGMIEATHLFAILTLWVEIRVLGEYVTRKSIT